MKLLVFGGSGFVSRYVVSEAMAKGYEVFYVTRGQRDTIPGAHALVADRNNIPVLQEAIRSVGGKFDAVIDCICFSGMQARDDLAVVPEFSDRLIVISTDSLYHPDHKRVPQDENGAVYMTDSSYGGKKREMELVFLNECPSTLKYTIFRPPHMFGAGSELGCFPIHTRQKDLLAQLRCGNPIRLVGGGEYLIQPLYAGDLAAAVVACIPNPNAYNEVFCIAGPKAMPNRKYFETLGDLTGLPVIFEDIDQDEYAASHDDGYLYFCHRAYDLSKLANAGIPVPKVTLREGLREQIEWLIQQGR